ncbi:MAG TPA: serine/threonine-protein kinase, partial [Pirellulales bacterium]|nr:serine/threonine-protein kinase [Pirellulales bacterium]
MAEQMQPVRRKVAIKIIKPGMDTKQVIARFEVERQALALMEHPNIAKIFEGGVTESGRPYFVLELVNGLPITEFCDSNRLTPRERLELFLSVCQAVQHAHQKGIIHRDLKPSNVLVSMHDATPVVRVIDFGVAKALGQELTEKTLFTGFAQMIGTPLYMSPEQAGGSTLDTDTRSDIYTLGVLLYELLAGTTPFDQERFRKAAYDEICRIVREEEPPRPSTRLSELGAALSTISAQREMEPVKLTKLVRGELDWIVMKSLEKDRNRRYETASGLADDVARYLRGEPVLACPPSAAYRLRKFAHKHRAGLATAGAFALFLVAATAVSVSLAVRADRERVRAVKAEKSATEHESHERARADELAATLAERVYVADIQYARDLCERGELENCRAVLSQHGPVDRDKEPRGFEWGYLWSLAASTPSERTRYRGHRGNVYHATFSPDGLTVASGGEDCDIHLWDARTGLKKGKIKAHTNDVNWLAFSPDGKLLASASDDATIRLWNVATQAALSVLRGHIGPVESIAFSPDGRSLVSGGKDGIVRLWDIATAQLAKELTGHSQNVECVAYAPDGKSVVSGSFDCKVKIWNVAGERGPLTIAAPGSWVTGVAVSPDGSMVASASHDGSTAIFDAATGNQRATFKSHEGPARGVCFTADNRFLASCGNDGRVSVWLCGLKENPSKFTAGDLVWSLSFSRDGRSLVTTTRDGAIRVWNWPARNPV